MQSKARRRMPLRIPSKVLYPATPDVRGDASSTTITTQAQRGSTGNGECGSDGCKTRCRRRRRRVHERGFGSASIPAANTDQRPATSAIPAEVQNVNPKEVLQATPADFQLISHVASDPSRTRSQRQSPAQSPVQVRNQLRVEPKVWSFGQSLRRLRILSQALLHRWFRAPLRALWHSQQ